MRNRNLFNDIKAWWNDTTPNESNACVRYSVTDHILRIAKLEKELSNAKIRIACLSISNEFLEKDLARSENNVALSLKIVKTAKETIKILRDTQLLLAAEIQNPTPNV